MALCHGEIHTSSSSYLHRNFLFSMKIKLRRLICCFIFVSEFSIGKINNVYWSLVMCLPSKAVKHQSRQWQWPPTVLISLLLSIVLTKCELEINSK